MIVLDTNVVSEAAKPAEIRDGRVVAWLYANLKGAALPTIAVAEMFAGAEAMDDGRRKDETLSIYREICDLLKTRILTFDMAAALAFPRIAIECARKGRPLLASDCQIASIAFVHGAAVATRDKAFRTTSLEILNPWEE